MNQRYVITGAPGTGKTAIINALKKRGYSCVDENSREIIAEQIINGGEILPWENQIAFENFNKAKAHINKYWKDLDSWWKCKNVQSARKIFLTNFFNVKPDWYREWSDYIHSSLFS